MNPLMINSIIAASRNRRVAPSASGSPTTQQEWWDAERVKAGVTMATNFSVSSEVTNYRHLDGQQANVVWDAEGAPGTSGGSLKLNIPDSTGTNPGAWRRKMNDAWSSVTDGFLNTEFFVYYMVKLGPGYIRPSNDGGGKKLCIISAVKIGDENSSSSAQAFEIVNNCGNNGSTTGTLNFYHSISKTFQRNLPISGSPLSTQPGLDWGAGLADQKRYSIWNTSDDLSPGALHWEEGIDIRVKVRIKCGLYGGPSLDEDPANDVNEMDVWVAWPGDSTWRKLYDNALLSGISLGPNDSFYTGGFSGLWFTAYDTNRTSGNGDTWLKVKQVICSTQDIGTTILPLEASPAWYTAMNDKTWADPVGNTISDVYQQGGAGLPASGLFAWSSGVAHRDRGSLRHFGGGHTDNDVNSLLEVILRTASPVWARLTSPSSNAGGTPETGVYGDGQPRSSHTWHHLVDVPGFGTWMAPLPGTYVSGANSGRFFNFNDSTLAWVAKGYAPGTSSSAGIGDANTLGHTDYDGRTGRIFVSASQGAFWTIDPATSAASAKSATNDTNYYMSAALARNRRLFLIWKQSTNAIRAYNIDGDSISTPGISGTGPGITNPGMVWHEPSGAFLAWGHTTSRDSIYKLTPPSTQATTFSGTYTWSTVSPDASNSVTPSAPATGGSDMPTVKLLKHFGGLRKDLLVVHPPSATAKVYCYKLPIGGV